MKKLLLVLVLALMVPFAFGPGPAAGAEGYVQVADQWGSELLYPEELDDLLAPIALYPDPLIAQILPAATFIDQIRDAARYVRRYGSSRVDYQPWDLSVRAVAHYPKVLYMMEREVEWTASVGQAFVEQPQDVMDAIQRLRDYARSQGNLYSTREQQVLYEADVIRIVPARPQYLYIPVYDPQVIYVERYSPSYPFITFSTGFTIGAWLNRDCDWRERRVYYHGWRGSGWVNRARPHIRDRGIYINRRASVINVNNRVVQHDTRVYRQQLRNEGLRRRDERRLSPPPTRTEQPRPGRMEQQRPGRIEQPRPGRIERQSPGIIKQPRPDRIEQQRPGRIQQQLTPGVEQKSAPVRQQPPAASGQQRRPAGEGQGESRRRALRQTNRPKAPAQSAPAVIPAPVITTPPVQRSIQTPVPGTTVPPAPGPAVTPAPRPTVIPGPAPSVAPIPRAAEPPASSRPAREHLPGSGRGIQPSAPSGTRAAPR